MEIVFVDQYNKGIHGYESDHLDLSVGDDVRIGIDGPNGERTEKKYNVVRIGHIFECKHDRRGGIKTTSRTVYVFLLPGFGFNKEMSIKSN